MSQARTLHVWSVCLDAIDEARANACRTILSEHENARADRYAFASDRIQYLVAHALLRRTLTFLYPAVAATDWQFIEGAHRKPEACFDGNRAPVSFNLSHTNGMVGVAAAAYSSIAIGFDLEPLNRRVTLDVADRYFRPEEASWLTALPPHRRACGFLRLWTLKEAFIKATGEGLARDLASFWFTTAPPRIRFVDDSLEQQADWHFEQRIIDDRFVAAVGVHAPAGEPELHWHETMLETGAAASFSGV